MSLFQQQVVLGRFRRLGWADFRAAEGVSPKSDQVWIRAAFDLASEVSNPSAETHDGSITFKNTDFRVSGRLNLNKRISAPQRQSGSSVDPRGQ